MHRLTRILVVLTVVATAGRESRPGETDAATVVERPIGATDFQGAVCPVLGIDNTKKDHPPGVDPPIPIVDTSKGVKVLTELL